MIGTVIYEILSTDTAVAALVKNRILPIGAEQTTPKPYIVFQQISGVREKTKDRNHGVKTDRFQLDIYDEKYNKTAELADAVCEALNNKSGTFAGIEVDIITFEDENDFFSDKSEVHRKEQDYLIRVNK